MPSNRTWPSRLAVVGATVAVLASVVGFAPGPAAAFVPPRVLACSTDGPAVTGYAEESISAATVRAQSPALRTLAVDGVNISARGDSLSQPDADARRLLLRARASHVRAEFLVGNYSESLGDFDPLATHRLVHSAAHRAAVVRAVRRAVHDQGWDGVQIDLEAIRADDRAGLVILMKQLRAALPAGTAVSMAMSAFTSEQEFRANGYDLAALGRVVDRVTLMAYDQHGPTWTAAGPIGGLPWQRKALAIVLKRVPAAKVDLGVAGYGYTWPRTGSGVQVSDAQARQLVAADSARARWNPTQGEWTARLSDGTVLWWSDARSWKPRADLAEHLGLHGMALWSLGLADPLPAAVRPRPCRLRLPG